MCTLETRKHVDHVGIVSVEQCDAYREANAEMGRLVDPYNGPLDWYQRATRTERARYDTLFHWKATHESAMQRAFDIDYDLDRRVPHEVAHAMLVPQKPQFA